MSARCHDLELQISYLKKDNDMFVQKNSFLQDEVLSLTDQIKDVQPRLMKMEPEYTRLAEEKSMWTSQREDANKELHEHRLVCSTLTELNNSLQTLSTNDDLSEQQSSESKWNLYSLSQQHVMWCGIPALRRLSPLLYDQIRAMFQDLRKMEKEVSECRDNYEVDADDLRDQLKKKTAEIKENEAFIRDSKGHLETLTKRVQECTSELHEKREACAILDNIRIVLKSSASTVINKSMGGMSPGKRATNATRSMYSGFDLDYDDGLQQPIEDINLQDLSEQLMMGETNLPDQVCSVLCFVSSIIACVKCDPYV
jgi:DNA repair exonuclease SbcCD ATPase subunit